MDCPKCGFALSAEAVDCPRCGIVIAKFLRAREVRPAVPDRAAVAAARDDAMRQEWRETMARAAGLPAALLGAWLAVRASPGLIRMITMWVHESGHAVTAWMCGYVAMPGPWFTTVATTRSPFFAALVVGAVAFGGYHAWQRRRWFWVAAAGAGVLATLGGTLLLSPASAQQLIIFGGDGGCFVLGTMLMLTLYARDDHPVSRNQLRWGLLAIGALAFVDAYHVWSGPIGGLPFGENENGMSDPSVLTEGYGWTPLLLVARYLQLAHACLGVLLAVYVAAVFRRVAGVDSTAMRERDPGTLREAS